MGWGFWRRADADARGAAPSAKRGSPGDDGEGARGDPAATLRTRARRRLIGAAALLLAVAVVLPMLLDKEPRPVPDAIPLDIPSDKTPFAPRLALPPPPESGAAPVAPMPDATPVPDKHDEPTSEGDRTETAAKTPEKGDAKAPPKASTTAGAKGAARAADEARARAILEGRTAVVPAAPVKNGKYVLQAAALGSEAAARELSTRLKKAGFATFTERTETKDGVRYRVRLGPYATRDEAERVRARLRAIGIDASVVGV